MVRRGAAQGQVTATFELAPSHPVLALLAENGITDRSSRRSSCAGCRARTGKAVFLNDTSVSVQLLRQVGQALVEIRRPARRPHLSIQAGTAIWSMPLAVSAQEGRRAGRDYAAWQAAEAAHAGHASGIAASRADADYLSHALDELRELNPSAARKTCWRSAGQLSRCMPKIAAELAGAGMLLFRGKGPAAPALPQHFAHRAPASVGGAVLALVAEALERVLAETNTARARIEEALALRPAGTWQRW